MKAEIVKYEKGLFKDGHTFYKLELAPETKEEEDLIKELNRNFVVWVSPCLSKGKNIAYWGKK